ncbi:hypothetical protein CBM2586_A50443 [Cupriavidus phytorum]|uniref:Apea-like HEPN domain-containing protein n=1 Tax=Cupriavidus taiwanensis TaxID=164546 RepID=A0A975XA80_9BURK|nr:HEPN domain-containing protein [Cupriavidus taiwanensis]SOY62198.1 hypothetical protein CBM2586_A50443 [Cupriavidus taiwanensis]
MPELEKKAKRIIGFALERLARPGAYTVPQSIAEWKLIDRLTVELRLGNGQTIFLSKTGSTHFRCIVQTIYEANLYTGDADYSDIWTACKKVFERLLSNKQLPDGADELARLVSDEINQEVRSYTYAIAIHGVELKNSETAVQLGSLSLAQSPIPLMTSAGISAERSDVVSAIESMKHYKWLIGPARGTQRVSEKRYRASAELVCGMLAITAAVMCSRGAEPFSIGPVLSPEQSHGRAAWLSWTDNGRGPITHGQFLGSQPFVIDETLSEQLANSTIFRKALEIVGSDTPTELEDKICRSIYWFADAHRDQNPVTKLVKYWSCVEVFFTANEKDVTAAVAAGIATVLVFGDFSFVPTEEYFALKKRAAKLYGYRSRAVHHGSREHVSENDVAELSLIAARLIISVLSFVERGYRTVTDVKEHVKRLDSVMQQGKKE